MATCPDCGAVVTQVRDSYTGATFPVQPSPVEVDGFQLDDPRPGERLPRAHLHTVRVHEPHFPLCRGEDARKEREREEDDEQGETGL